ncbi:hypothetical protein ACWCV9_24255 [Streptomyces sp. NPDC001606]
MRKVLPLALTGLLALTACQFTGHDDDHAEQARRLNTMAAFPLHSYLPDPASDDGKAIVKAQWLLAKRCMIGLGYAGFSALDTSTVESTYPVRKGNAPLSSSVGDDSPYGVDDPDLAAQRGYHLRDPEKDSQPQEWPDDQYLALTGAFGSGDSHLAHGHAIPEGGCLGRATRTLYGAPPKATKVGKLKLTGSFALAMELWYESHKEARKDPAWKKADRAWSACMKKKGFHYSDPDQATDDFAWHRTDGPSEKETKTATADARCKLDTDYIRTVHTIDIRAQKAAIGRHKADLDRVLAADARALDKARTVIDQES